MSSLFNKNPPLVINLEPKLFSIVVVIDKALPYTSTIEICDVDGNSIEISSVKLLENFSLKLPGLTFSILF